MNNIRSQHIDNYFLLVLSSLMQNVTWTGNIHRKFLNFYKGYKGIYPVLHLKATTDFKEILIQ